MQNFFRYFGLTLFTVLVLSLVMLAWGTMSLYRMMSDQFSTMALENYTCADFRREVQDADGPALRPLVAAVMAYGMGTQSIEQLEATFNQTGIIPAVGHVYQLCESAAQTPLLRVLIDQAVSPTAAISATAPVMPVMPSSTVVPQNPVEDL